MFDTYSEYPNWLLEQRGRRYRGRATDAGFLNRFTLTRRYADHLMKEGKPVTFEAIREMLHFVNRGYNLGPQQISAALASRYARTDNPLPKMLNGRPVWIEGIQYPSSRSAAEALGIAPQTVLNRIASAKPKWNGWKRQAVLNSVSVITDTE